MSLLKTIVTIHTPGTLGTPAIPPYTVCPAPPPGPNNGGGGGDSGHGPPPLNCFFVPNQYGGTMEVCI